MRRGIVVATMSVLATGAIAQPVPELIRTCGKTECRAFYGLQRDNDQTGLADGPPGVVARVGIKQMRRAIFDNVDTVGESHTFAAACRQGRIVYVSEEDMADPPVRVGQPIGQYTAAEVRAVFDWACWGKTARARRPFTKHEPN